MIEAIGQVNGNSPFNQAPTAIPAVTAAQQQQQTIVNHNDTAFLSETAQALLLQQQGFTVGEIADVLGITQTDAEGFLGFIAITTNTGTTAGTNANALAKAAGAA